jgi:pimeloyl-ACP methyl ester carboxylesterase
MRDPYVPGRFGREYADALPDAELVELPDAGHWPWLDRPDSLERVVEFVNARGR